MNILVINCGSSSLKYQLINADTEEVLAKGLCERIGIDGGMHTYQKKDSDKVKTNVDMPSHTKAVSLVLEALTDPANGVIKSLSEIDAVGHRIVHGGEKFAKSVIIDDEVLAAIKECNDLAPLHNPANLIGVDSCKELMPNVPMVAVFDTAFHQTMPPKAYLYGIPYEYYKKYKVRRYGFHGTSHDYVAHRTAEFLGKDIKDMKIIVCHLGNGSSISATVDGNCVDTSMGLTPLEGLPMGTRSGDLDPAILEYICRREKKSIQDMLYVLNHKSGVFGLSNGLSSDFRDLRAAAERGDRVAAETLDVFAYRIIKYIGAYAAAMNGVDAITLTGGIGENATWLRPMIFDSLRYLGVKMDLEKMENTVGKEMIISAPDSKVTVSVIPTNEELAIARECKRLLEETT